MRRPNHSRRRDAGGPLALSLLGWGLVACSSSVVLPKDPQADLQPTVVLPGSPLTLAYDPFLTDLQVDYGEVEAGGQTVLAELRGGPQIVALPLEALGPGTFTSLVPPSTEAPSTAYQVRLTGRAGSRDFPLEVLGLKTELSACVPGEPPLLSAHFVGSTPDPRPGHAVTLGIEATGSIFGPDCTSPLTPLTFTPGQPPPDARWCLLGTREVTITAAALKEVVTLERPFQDAVALELPAEAVTGECVPVGVSCPDCGPVAVARFDLAGSPVEQPLYSDPECATPSDRADGKVFLRLPADPGRLVIHLGGCDWRGQAELLVRPRLVTLAKIAVGVPFPVDAPPGCVAQLSGAAGRLVAAPASGLGDGAALYTFEGARDVVGQEVRIRCGDDERQPLSAPIQLGWCEHTLPPLSLDHLPRTITPAGRNSAQDVTFRLDAARTPLAAVLFSPNRGSPWIWTDPNPTCNATYCFTHRFLATGPITSEPRIHEAQLLAWDEEGCVGWTDRALVEAPATSTFTITSTGSGERIGSLGAALAWLTGRPPQAPTPVLRLGDRVRAPGLPVQLDRPVVVVGGGQPVEVGELKLGGGAAGSALYGLDLTLERVLIEADEVTIRDSVIRWQGQRGESPLVSVQGRVASLGPNLTLEGEGLEQPILSLEGERATVRRVQTFGGSNGLAIWSTAVVTQVALIGAQDVAVHVQVAAAGEVQHLRWLTIDAPRDGVGAESSALLTESIVVAGSEAVRGQGKAGLEVQRSWLDPSDGLGLPGAPRIDNQTFVDRSAGDLRLRAETFGIDPGACVGNQLCAGNVDLNGPLPGPSSGRAPDLGAFESSYSGEN